MTTPVTDTEAALCAHLQEHHQMLQLHRELLASMLQRGTHRAADCQDLIELIWRIRERIEQFIAQLRILKRNLKEDPCPESSTV